MRKQIAFLFLLSGFIKTFSQDKLHYLQVLHSSIENVSAIHLQGRLAASETVGATMNKFNRNNFCSLDLIYHVDTVEFAFRLKAEINQFNQFSFRRIIASINPYFKVGKHHVLSFGIDLQYLHLSYKANTMIFGDQLDTTPNTLKPTREFFKREMKTGSVNTSLLFYNTGGRYYLGIKGNDITQPNVGISSSTGFGTSLPSFWSVYGGLHYLIFGKLSATTSFSLTSGNHILTYFLRQDLIYDSKFTLAVETGGKNSIRLYAGYQPLKKLKGFIMIDVMPNEKAITGNTNYYKLMVSYAL
jgi:hypothetical protein